MDFNLVTASYWEYPSNFSNGTAVTGLGSLFKYVNYAMGDLFGYMLLLALAAIAFFTLKGSGYPASKAFAATSFVCTLLATTLMMAGILTIGIVIICAVITIIMALAARAEANIGL